MAVKVVHVSDISGKEADEQSLRRLVSLSTPSTPTAVTSGGAAGGSSRSRARAASSPSSGSPRRRKGNRMVISLDDFNLLAEAGVMSPPSRTP